MGSTTRWPRRRDVMRVRSAVTSISWIPSEAITGPMRLPMDLGVGHYDPPPPDRLDDLEQLREADRFRFANELRAWIEVEDGRITDHGRTGGGRIGATTLRLGSMSITIPAVPYPDLRPNPEVGEAWVRFEQTAGGRTGAPMPRHVSRPPYVQLTAPTAWTTLALTIHADGRSECELVGASPFPRHWVYDHSGQLVAKSGLVDYTRWSHQHFGRNSPWGDHDEAARVTGVESALERELSTSIMRGPRRPERRRLAAGELLAEQGARCEELFLLLDGVLSVEVDGGAVAEVGPGSILGERAILEGGRRTATLRAVTPARVAVAEVGQLDLDALAETAKLHRREKRDPSAGGGAAV
jgi:hypothetical protein